MIAASSVLRRSDDHVSAPLEESLVMMDIDAGKYYLLDDIVTQPPDRDLAALADHAARGPLTVDVDTVRAVDALPEVLRALAERRVTGKAVLRMR